MVVGLFLAPSVPLSFQRPLTRQSVCNYLFTCLKFKKSSEPGLSVTEMNTSRLNGQLKKQWLLLDQLCPNTVGNFIEFQASDKCLSIGETGYK